MLMILVGIRADESDTLSYRINVFRAAFYRWKLGERAHTKQIALTKKKVHQSLTVCVCVCTCIHLLLCISEYVYAYKSKMESLIPVFKF